MLLLDIYPILTHLVAAALVAFMITAAYKTALLSETDMEHLNTIDSMWRVLIGLGAVPGVIALYFRLTIPETPRFTMDIECNIDQATNDIENVLDGKPTRNEDSIQRVDAPKASWADFRAYFGQAKNFKILFGAAYSWFALDVCPHPAISSSACVLTRLIDRLLWSWSQLRSYSPSNWFRDPHLKGCYRTLHRNEG